MKGWREKGWCEWEQGGTLILMGQFNQVKSLGTKGWICRAGEDGYGKRSGGS